VWLAEQELSDEESSMYHKMASVCMSQNYFKFDSKFYQQTHSTAMGNALSPLLANLLMSFFEIHFKKSNLLPKIRIRYVDDIFVVINGRKMSPTLRMFNEQHSFIKFTSEEEEFYFFYKVVFSCLRIL
jgi:hypothetical protein